MEKALKIQPRNISFLSNLGTAYQEMGNLKEAMNNYEKALAINPNHTNANYNLGLVFYKLGELKSAKS